MRLRCSDLPAALACPGSVRPAAVKIRPVSKVADGGTASHEVMRAIVDMDLQSTDDVDVVAIARRFDVDPEDLRIRAFVGVKAWKTLRDFYPNGQAEVSLQGAFELESDTIIELTGRLDLLSVDRRARRARVGDWKFSRVDNDHSHQVRGGGALVLFTYPEVDVVDLDVAWMLGREPELERYTFTRDDLVEWMGEIDKRVVRWDGETYSPGPQCTYCRRNHECPAMTAMVRSAVEKLTGPEMAAQLAGNLMDVPDADVVDLHRRAKAVASVIETLGSAVKMRVEAAGGVLKDGRGRELRFVESARRRVDTLAAWPVLQERLTPEEIAAFVEISASGMDDAIAAKTPRGGKKKAIEELDRALRDADAVTEVTTRRLTDMRSKEPTNE